MSTCGITGTAVVQRGRNHESGVDEVVWLQADDAIHVVEELVQSEEARDRIGEKYQIGEWCSEASAFHARLIDGGA